MKSVSPRMRAISASQRNSRPSSPDGKFLPLAGQSGPVLDTIRYPTPGSVTIRDGSSESSPSLARTEPKQKDNGIMFFARTAGLLSSALTAACVGTMFVDPAWPCGVPPPPSNTAAAGWVR